MRWWWWVPVSLGVITALILVAALSVQRSRATLIQLVRLIPTCISLLHDIMRDKNVPRRAKLAPAIALIYLANPIDLIPDFIPGLGYLDDALIVAWALRHLIAAAGHDRVTAHWHATQPPSNASSASPGSPPSHHRQRVPEPEGPGTPHQPPPTLGSSPKTSRNAESLSPI